MPTCTICTGTPFPTFDGIVAKWPWDDFNWPNYNLVLPSPLIALPDPVIPNVWNTVWSISQAIGEIIRAQAMAVWKVLMETVDSVLGILDSIPKMIPFNISFPDMLDPAAVAAAIAALEYPSFPWEMVPNFPAWPGKFIDDTGECIAKWFRSTAQKGKEMMSAFIQACEDYLDMIKTTFLKFMQMVIDLIPSPLPKPSLPSLPSMPTMTDLLALIPPIPDLPKLPEIPGPPWDKYIPEMPDLKALLDFLPPIPLLSFEISLPQQLFMATPDVDVWEIIKAYLAQWSAALLNMIWMWIEAVKSMLDVVIVFPALPTICFPIQIELKPPGLPQLV